MARLNLEPARLDLTVTQGKTWAFVFTLNDPAGEPLDLDGYTATWAVRAFATAAGDPIVAATVGDGVTIDGNTITVAVPPEDTADVPQGRYVHEIELVEPSGHRPPFVGGRLTVFPEVVR